MVTKQDLIDLCFTEGSHDHKDSFYDLQSNGYPARYFFSVANGMFKNNMLCFLNSNGYFDHNDGHLITSKAQLQKLLKLHGF